MKKQSILAISILMLLSGALSYGLSLEETLRTTKRCVRCDLKFIDLTSFELSEADLSGADLRWAVLNGANLSKANLSKANLKNAFLSGAYLQGANLQGANLIDANLSKVKLAGAKMNKKTTFNESTLETSYESHCDQKALRDRLEGLGATCTDCTHE